MRYVTKRHNRGGGERHYWQRPGQPLTRLPDDPVARFTLQKKLNEAADRKDGDVLIEGSIGWVIQRYRATDRFKKLARGTLKYYGRYLREVEDLGKMLPFRAFDRRMVVDFVETFTKKGEQRKVAAVLRNLFDVALYEGVAVENHATKLRLTTNQSREAMWSDGAIKAWLAAAEGHAMGAAMTLAFRLLQFTAQRPGDVLAMTWSAWNGDLIRVRQQKTKKLLDVPAHSELRAILEEARRGADSLMIVSYRGRAVSYAAMNRAWQSIGLASDTAELQARDLRRTACVRMCEAGATEKQIAAVTGHSIDETRHILETYLPTTTAMARAAIERLETKR